MIKDRARRDVNVQEFLDAGVPENLGPLDIQCPVDHQYILRMAVRAQGSAIHLPTGLHWVQEMLNRALADQSRIGVDHPFIYITVRHGLVASETDDAWHVDGFSTKIAHPPEQNYI